MASVGGVTKDQGEEDVQHQRAEGGFKGAHVPGGSRAEKSRAEQSREEGLEGTYDKN